MKRIISTIAVSVLCIAGAARADKARSGHNGLAKDHMIRFTADTEFGIPLGNYSDVNSVGGGVSVTGEYLLLEMLSATLRIGFEAHVDRTLGTASSHVNAIPILLGTKYFIGPDRQGMFGAFELGMFDLMSSRTVGTANGTSNDVKFGMGVGLGYQQAQWNLRVNVHSQDVGNFGSAMMMTGGIGYQFAGL
jgi:hypothetical protein